MTTGGDIDVRTVTSRVPHPDPHTYTHHTGKCDCCSQQEIREGLIVYKRANICGVEFTAGQDVRGVGIQRRCGSIITCVVQGQSVYGKVIKFFKYVCDRNNDLFAYVDWFRKTDYPMSGTPLIVRVKDDAPVCRVRIKSSIYI